MNFFFLEILFILYHIFDCFPLNINIYKSKTLIIYIYHFLLNFFILFIINKKTIDVDL